MTVRACRVEGGRPEAPLTVPGGQTASCGIAEWDSEETGEALTARADAALYMAKRGGRAQAVLV